MTIRVATYNIHKCKGLDGRAMPDRIAAVIAEVQPDIIGLQEVWNVEGRVRELNQATYLAERLGMHLALGEVRKLEGAGYGNVVLSRFPLRGICTFDLSVPGHERRGCVRTDVRLPNGDVLHLFNVHLGTGYLERRLQARKLLQSEVIRDAVLNGPRIVLGDFNEWTRGLVSQVLSAEFRTADIRVHLRTRRTYPAVLPLLHLDHIYYDEDLTLERAWLHRTVKSMIASDHVPIVAEFALRG